MATAVDGLLPSMYIVASGALIGSVAGTVEHGLSSPPGTRLLQSLLALAVVFILQQTIGLWSSAVTAPLGRQVNDFLQARVMGDALSPAGVAHLEDPALADLIALAQGVGPGNVAPGSAVGGMVNQWARGLKGVAAALLISRFRWWLGPLLLVVQFMNLRLYLRGYVRFVQAISGRAQELRRSAYFRTIGAGPATAKEARIFGLRAWIAARFEGHWRSAMADLWRQRRKEAALQVIPVLTEPASFLLAFVLLARAAAAGTVSIGELAVYAQAILAIAIIGELFQGDLDVAYGTGAVIPALELGDHLRKNPKAVSGGSLPSTNLPSEEIRFEGVWFTYPGRDEPVFAGLDLTIRAGSSMAIVGVNGAGKTTLVKLLARLYDPDRGRITVDGVDLRDLDPVGWQRRIGAIFQDFARYALTVSDNVGFGAAHRLEDRTALERAAERAGASPAIKALPKGWDTVLSREFSGGGDLSGGQWQRIALARALFAVDGGASILVLDEPTANLDVRAEAELYSRFIDLTRGVTTIVISHRFSTVRQAGRVVVLDGGRVIEEGSHDELLLEDGTYASMFRLQATMFSDTTDPEHR